MKKSLDPELRKLLQRIEQADPWLLDSDVSKAMDARFAIRNKDGFRLTQFGREALTWPIAQPLPPRRGTPLR